MGTQILFMLGVVLLSLKGKFAKLHYAPVSHR